MLLILKERMQDCETPKQLQRVVDNQASTITKRQFQTMMDDLVIDKIRQEKKLNLRENINLYPQDHVNPDDQDFLEYSMNGDSSFTGTGWQLPASPSPARRARRQQGSRRRVGRSRSRSTERQLSRSPSKERSVSEIKRNLEEANAHARSFQVMEAERRLDESYKENADDISTWRNESLKTKEFEKKSFQKPSADLGMAAEKRRQQDFSPSRSINARKTSEKVVSPSKATNKDVLKVSIDNKAGVSVKVELPLLQVGDSREDAEERVRKVMKEQRLPEAKFDKLVSVLIAKSKVKNKNIKISRRASPGKSQSSVGRKKGTDADTDSDMDTEEYKGNPLFEALSATMEGLHLLAHGTEEDQRKMAERDEVVHREYVLYTNENAIFLLHADRVSTRSTNRTTHRTKPKQIKTSQHNAI